MLASAGRINIIQIIGVGPGRAFDLSQTRYGKVILIANADVDGARICTLLLTLSFRYMRLMVEVGHIYAAVPPLCHIEIAGKGCKKRGYIYTYSEDELHRRLAALRRLGYTWKELIQRYKGLGEMNADQLAETTTDRAHRSLRRITLAGEEAPRQAEDVFKLFMGSTAGPRKKFTVEESAGLDRTRTDV